MQGDGKVKKQIGSYGYFARHVVVRPLEINDDFTPKLTLSAA